jgi:cytochrome c peroxidase
VIAKRRLTSRRAAWRSAGLLAAVVALLLAGLWAQRAGAFPVDGQQTVLPTGSELYEETLDRPREVFKSEASGGHRSVLVVTGDAAFGSPAILGGVARQAGMSCSTCHVNGAGNAKLFIPGLSTRPGNFDATGPLFNPKADNGALDPVTPPSLRGARYLGPYGHDGRFASLRDFVHNVIVGEFAGAEPSSEILDALVAYIQDIDFLPNPKIGPEGRLAEGASAAARRGEALFHKPFPHDATMSCAACHMPSGAFVDHRQHDVGSGGLFKTPTLLNANFNAPYFHDGRYATYDEVIAHFDRSFALHLSPRDRQDLAAYLASAGDGVEPYLQDSVALRLKEIDIFAGALRATIVAQDGEAVAVLTDRIGGELRELTDAFPDRRDTTVTGGKPERAQARAALKELVLLLRRIDDAAASHHFDEAAAQFAAYRDRSADAAPLLRSAEPWSLFVPAAHEAHYAALRRLADTASATPR